MNFSKLSLQDVLRGGLLALAVLIPWVYCFGFESAYTLPKLTTLRAITLAMVAVWLLQLIAQRGFIYRRSPLNKWIVGYAVVLGLTTLTSTYFWVSFFGDQNRFLGLMTMLNLLFLTWAALNLFTERKTLLRYIQVSVWAAIATGVYGLLQWQGWIGSEEWAYENTFRVFGTMGHSNHFGAYLGFHLMLLLGLVARSSHARVRWAYAVGAVPMLLSLVATASRGAFVAFLLGLALFGLGMALRKREWLKRKKKILLGTLATALLVGVALFQPISTTVQSIPVVSRTIDTLAFIEEGNVPDRVSWWLSSAAMVADAPILGHGLSTYFTTYSLYRRADYRVPGDIQDGFTPETAHMEYLDIAATQGLLGLAVYLGLIVCVLRLLMKTLRHPDVSTPDKITALSLGTALSVYLIQVLLSFGVVGTLVPFTLLLGVTAAWFHLVADTRSQVEQFAKQRWKPEMLFATVALMSVVGLLSAWFTVRQAQAEWYLEKALNEKTAGEVALALEAHEKSVQAMPWMSHYWEAYAQTAFDFTAFDTDPEIIDYLMQTSTEAYAQAHQLVKTLPHIQANWAIAAITYAEFKRQQGDILEADVLEAQGIDLYREATEVGVNNPRFQYNFGVILRTLGEYEQALGAFEATLAIRTPYKDASYQAAWMATELKDYDSARVYIQQALLETPGDENVKILLQRINSEDH